jgi:Fe-S cluster assembly protein SufD
MTVADALDRYQAWFERFLEGRGRREPGWLTTIRRAAIARFAELGFPTTRDEEWRFTPVGRVATTPFRPADEAGTPVSRADVQPFLIPRFGGSQIVFVNGRFAPELSVLRAVPRGVQLTSLARALEEDPGLVDPYLTRCASFDRQAFTALNTAFAEDGAVLYLPADTTLDDPVHILYFAASAAPIVTHPRTVVVAGDNSRVRLVESYAGAPGAEYFTNAVTEIVGGAGARLEHVRTNRESVEASHVSSTHVYLEGGAVFTQQNVTLGGAFVRNDITALLDAPGIVCTLDGLYLADGDRLVDNHTAIVHAKPHCESHEVYKGMLGGRARGVFNGKIFVRPDAQKTDAKQTNQVLLLSDDATINTKPQLEIFADDVKCTHGATVGRLDEEALFYLRARGIGRDEARAILIHAFASDIIDRIAVEPVREALEAVLLTQLPR